MYSGKDKYTSDLSIRIRSNGVYKLLLHLAIVTKQYVTGTLGWYDSKHVECSFLFGLLLYIPSQQLWSWRDGSSLSFFFQSKLEQAGNQYLVHILSLISDSNVKK